MVTQVHPSGGERGSAAPEGRSIETALEVDGVLVGAETKGRRAVARSPRRLADQARLRRAGRAVLTRALGAGGRARGPRGDAWPLGRGHGVGPGSGEDR